MEKVGKRKEIDVLSCFVMFRVIQNEMQPKLRGLDHQPSVICKNAVLNLEDLCLGGVLHVIERVLQSLALNLRHSYRKHRKSESHVKHTEVL